MKFYKSEKAVLLLLSGETEMAEITAGTADASAEKHVPVYEVSDGKVLVKVGSAEHPMLEKHFIEWVSVKTDKGIYTKFLEPSQKPEVCFEVGSEEVKEVYAYCNIHGLWKAE